MKIRCKLGVLHAAAFPSNSLGQCDFKELFDSGEKGVFF